MSKMRKRVIGPVQPISDTNKLFWERYYKPMQSAAAMLNAAVANTENMLASIILEREGFSPDTHLFDIGNLRIVPRPKAKGDNGSATVD